MRYFLEYCPSSCFIDIHVDRLLTEEVIELFELHEGQDGEKGSYPPLVRSIFCIPGVMRVFLNPQSLGILKDQSFSWDEIVPKVINVLLACIEPTGSAVMARQPVHPSALTPEVLREREEKRRILDEHERDLDDLPD